MLDAFGSSMLTKTRPARVSASVCETDPAIVTGLEAPSWPKTLQ